MDWQPIETAPKDGTPILVYLPKMQFNSHLHVATYHPNLTVIGGCFDFDLPCKPTHWMPLPNPPTKDKQ